MSNFLRTHLTVLQSSAVRFADSPAFKVPAQIDPVSARVSQWRSISYSSFYEDVLRGAGHWLKILESNGVPPRSVVGIWVGGTSYADVVTIYSVSRAGYIPQLFTQAYTCPEVVSELLLKAKAKAFIHDPSYTSLPVQIGIPTFKAVHADIMQADSTVVPDMAFPLRDEIAYYHHTSGSTSGIPKLVPCTYLRLDSMVNTSHQMAMPLGSSQDMSLMVGSICYIAQTFLLLGGLQHGTCTIQPSTAAFSSAELVDMIQNLGLNRLNQFPTLLTAHLQSAREDPQLLALLKGLDEVRYSGATLTRQDEAFAVEHSIRLRNAYGLTESSGLMLSLPYQDVNSLLLRPYEGVAYRFVPTTSEGVGEGAQLLELVVQSTSPNCPHISLRSEDGHFHTGDLFEEVAPNAYLYRGRDDEWVKAASCAKIDTRAIADNVRAICGSLITDCVVVGSLRPSPVLFVEPSISDMDSDALKEEIIRKTSEFHSRRFSHERITSTRCIIVVPRGTLPRTATKGNIQRHAVERMFKAEIDAIFATPL